jgi:hypothetical protein
MEPTRKEAVIINLEYHLNLLLWQKIQGAKIETAKETVQTVQPGIPAMKAVAENKILPVD